MRRFIGWIGHLPWWGKGLLITGGVIVTGISAFIALPLYSQSQSNSTKYIRRWFDSQSNRPELITQREACPDAPFILPSEGFIGLLWRDPAGPYNILNRHSGIDVFGDGEPGEIPVYAVYDGYLNRLDSWKSTVIIRHDDPFQPGRTIWTYYTHMASVDGEPFIAEEFPPGTENAFVEQGTLLGYQGEYSGGGPPIGLHVHMSIVKSNDDGTFKNEADINNTLDPSPYFGMMLNIDDLPERPVQCENPGG